MKYLTYNLSKTDHCFTFIFEVCRIFVDVFLLLSFSNLKMTLHYVFGLHRYDEKSAFFSSHGFPEYNVSLFFSSVYFLDFPFVVAFQ